MKDEKRTYTKTSEQFGELSEGTSQVYSDFEPADASTYAALVFWLTELGIKPDRPTSEEKYIRALSDFCMANRSSIDGRIFWPSANDEFSGCPYTGSIVRPLKQAMTNKNMWRIQRSSKRDKLCTIYATYVPDFGHPLKFKPHGLGPIIKVRSPKVRREGKVTGGQNLSLNRFDQQEVKQLKDEVRIIRACMATHPLTHPTGSQFSTITRIFNNASLQQGGRSYGSYQNYAEHVRLKMTIDREPVCEIDIKSCYLSIIAGKQGIRLPDDPYSVLPYVQRYADAGDGAHKRARKLMKLMVSKLLSVDEEPSSFPQGEKVRATDGKTKTLTVKQKYNVPKKVTAKSLYAEIYETYRFLKSNPHNVFELMNIESNVMTATLLELALEDIPAYPVHDCLICKISESKRVLEALKGNLAHYIGAIPALDVTYPDGSCQVYRAEYPESYTTYSELDEPVQPIEVEHDSVIDDEDYPVLEDLSDDEGEEQEGIEEEKSNEGIWRSPPPQHIYQNPRT